MKKALSLALTMCIVLSLFATFAVTASAEATNVALNKEYTITGCGKGYENLTGQWPSSYTANLTDGAAHEELTFGETKNWFAFYYNNGADASLISAPDGIGAAVIDLGEVVNGVNKFRAHLGNHYANGVVNPKDFSVYYSVDGVEYTKAGTFEVKVTESKDDANAVLAYWTEIALDTAVSARYVKFEMTINGVFGFLNELEVYADPAAAAPSLTWQDGWVNDPADEDPSDGQNLIFNNAYDYTFTIDADKKIGGEDNALIDNMDDYLACNPNWAISVLLKPTAEAGTYEVAMPAVATPAAEAVDGKTVADVIAEKGINFENGNIVLVAHSSYSHDAGTNYTSKLCALALKVGDKVVVAEDKSTVYVVVPAGGVQTVKEEITVDGDLTDTGWAADKWVEVDGNNGFWQSPLPWQVEDGQYPDLGFKYQIRTDDTKLYVAVEVNCDVVEGGNGNGTNVRFWINTDEEATVYTHFYDVFKKDGAIAYNAKYNTSKTENSGANTENSTIVPALVSADGKTYVEFSVDLAEFGGEESFNYFVTVSNNPAGDDTPNVCLYYPAVPLGPITESHDGPEHIPYQNLPYVTWHRATQATADVEALKLGEVVVGGGSTEPEEEADTSLMGTAPTDSKFVATVTGPEAWKAGDKVTVDVTIEVTADELALSQIMFNLFYDAADLEFVAGEELGAVNVTTGADSWKGEDSMLTASVDGAYGKLEVGLASVEEADALVKGDKIVVSFEFTVKEDAEGLINFQLSNEELVGYTYDDPATALAGTGSSLAIAPAGDDLGDAGIYAIAALAIVALIGTAVVIKKRA